MRETKGKLSDNSGQGEDSCPHGAKGARTGSGERQGEERSGVRALAHV